VVLVYFTGVTSAFAWKYRGKSRKASGRFVGFYASITKHCFFPFNTYPNIDPFKASVTVRTCSDVQESTPMD
jgi:hypothetical protein